MARARLLGALGWRLFAAFTLVAVGAVGLLATVAALSVEHQTTALADQQVARTQRAIVRALQTAYARAGSWDGVDLGPVQALAEEAGIPVLVVDVSGGPVATVSPHESEPSDHPATATTTVTRGPGPAGSGRPGSSRTGTSRTGTSRTGTSSAPRTGHTAPTRSSTHATANRTGHGDPPAAGDPGEGAVAGDHATATGSGQARRSDLPADGAADVRLAAATPSATPAAADGSTTMAITVRGKRVGSVTFGEPISRGGGTTQARSQILDAVWIGGALAVGLAALAALLVSRRVGRPVAALVSATEAVERGVPDGTSELRGGPGEIGQLSRAFDRMAHTLQREDQLRRALVADVAHELRTPVTTLLGMTEELIDGLSEPTPQRLVSLHDEVLRLGRLVDDLAVLSAAQAAGLSLQRQPVDLTTMARDVVDLLGPQFTEAQLAVDVLGEPVTVTGDETRLRQVLTNLLTNAAKFTPAGGHVVVEVQRADGAAVLTVTDDGPGIPEDELAHVFDRFWRGRAAAGRAGSGIGLAVVAALTEAHGGTVSAQSPPGGGARFTVRLPAP